MSGRGGVECHNVDVEQYHEQSGDERRREPCSGYWPKGRSEPEMALHIGRFCGNWPELWLHLQDVFDLRHAGRSIAADLAEIKTVSSLSL